jgi:DNA-binding NtrC family response regulator
LNAGARTAAVLLDEAEAQKETRDTTPTEVGAAVERAVRLLEPESAEIRQPEPRRVLWVDDRPENNRLEQRALRELGIDVQLATSTEEALSVLEHDTFGAVISDMGRPPDPRAGYTLLNEMRRQGNQTPFVIYAGSRAPEHVAEARQRGAIGTTNRSSELIQLVARALNEREANAG